MKNATELLKQIEMDIREMLSEKRYKHSIGVMNRAKQLAKLYNMDEEKAMIVGLAHDIAKDISKQEKLEYVKEHNIEIDDIEKENVELLHAKIGANMCKEKYGFTEDMQRAIEYHTTGNPNMDILAKIIFVADKTEEGRKNADFIKINELEKEGIDQLLVYLIDNSIKYTIDKKSIIHPDSIYTRNRILLERRIIS